MSIPIVNVLYLVYLFNYTRTRMYDIYQVFNKTGDSQTFLSIKLFWKLSLIIK